MKPILLVIAALMIFGTLSAQNVKNRGVDVGDVMTLLRVAGYDLYSFTVIIECYDELIVLYYVTWR